MRADGRLSFEVPCNRFNEEIESLRTLYPTAKIKRVKAPKEMFYDTVL